VNELFGRTPSKSVNPDEAVAMGAAIQVHLLTVVHAEIKVILCGLMEMVLRYSLNTFCNLVSCVFRLDALAWSVIATATWLAGWLAGCLSQPVLYQND